MDDDERNAGAMSSPDETVQFDPTLYEDNGVLKSQRRCGIWSHRLC